LQCYREIREPRFLQPLPNMNMNTTAKGICWCIICCMVFLSSLTADCVQADSAVIEQLTSEIALAKNPAEKSRLHMFRARNYSNIGNMEMAESDYDAALKYDHKGWIHLERSRFYLAQKEFKQVVREATAARQETPTLKSSAEKLIVRAQKELKKKRREQSPREILLTKRWEVKYRRTPPSSAGKNARKFYAARSKQRTQQGPRRTARS